MLYFRRDDNQNDIIGIYNSEYEEIASYEYDSYGRILKVVDENGNIITDENHIAMINPYRYRSYYYDEETNLYYLNSRYYNPVWKRFINRDGIIGTRDNCLGYNLYAYCENNPVVSHDDEGEFAIALAIKVCAAIAALAVGAYYASTAGIRARYTPTKFSTTINAYRPYEQTKSKAKSKTKTKVVPIVGNSTSRDNSKSTYIYRWHGTNPGDLTPKNKDRDGLSLSKFPEPGSAETTIEKINATGVLYTVDNHKGHVSVLPIGGSIDDWIMQGSGSIWTGAMKSIVVKWDGVIK